MDAKEFAQDGFGRSAGWACRARADSLQGQSPAPDDVTTCLARGQTLLHDQIILWPGGVGCFCKGLSLSRPLLSHLGTRAVCQACRPELLKQSSIQGLGSHRDREALFFVCVCRLALTTMFVWSIGHCFLLWAKFLN